jgi:hypothetical protein
MALRFIAELHALCAPQSHAAVSGRAQWRLVVVGKGASSYGWCPDQTSWCRGRCARRAGQSPPGRSTACLSAGWARLSDPIRAEREKESGERATAVLFCSWNTPRPPLPTRPRQMGVGLPQHGGEGAQQLSTRQAGGRPKQHRTEKRKREKEGTKGPLAGNAVHPAWPEVGCFTVAVRRTESVAASGRPLRGRGGGDSGQRGV